MGPRLVAIAFACAFTAALGAASAQRDDAFGESRDHPAIAYSETQPADAVFRLNRRIASGDARLRFDEANGYLTSVLDALGVPVASQVLVYSQTSFQAPLIRFDQPRAVFFTDEVAVGWVRDGDVLEVSALDPRQGTIYYQIRQTREGTPAFTRNDRCLACHISWDTRAVPGPLIQTVFPRRSDREYANGFVVDHRVPLEERWGGWFVTGRRTPAAHVGNQALIQPTLHGRASAPRALTAVPGLSRDKGYLSDQSDIAALMVLEHQSHLTNLLTRAAWEARVAEHDGWQPRAAAAEANLPPRIRQAVDELADYMLFVDEAPIATPIEGGSGFAEWFAAQGPRDGTGRSLRELQLDGRLMRYPLSYMIYAGAFDALPRAVKDAIYRRIVEVLAGGDAARYAHLTPPIRQALLEILRDTKPDLPTDLR